MDNARAVFCIRSMEGVEGSGSGSGDPLATVGEATGNSMPAVSTVFVTIPQAATIVSGSGGKGIQYKWLEPEIQSVIQQPQPSVIQSPLQTVQISKGNVILLKQPANSVIQSTGGGTLQTVQVIDSEDTGEGDGSRKRQILARRPSYRKILNELGGGEISVIPAGSLQLSQDGEGLQTIAMTNTAGAGGAIVHYAQGSDGQFIVPVATSELGGIKIGAGGSIAQGVVLAAAPPQNTSTTTVHNTADQMAEEASRKREIRLMKNREAAKECRNKKKEYIKCLENRVAVLENQNKALIEELKTLKSLYCQNN